MKTFYKYYEEELEKEHRQISVLNPTAPNKCRRLLKRVAKVSKRSAAKTAAYLDKNKQFDKDRIGKSSYGKKRAAVKRKLGIGKGRSNYGIRRR